MKRLLFFLALLSLAALPALATEPGPAGGPAAVQTAGPAGSVGAFDLYGQFWFPQVCDAEWSAFDNPFGPFDFWEAYTWGFIRFHWWFDAQRFGWGWPGYFDYCGWDPWYGFPGMTVGPWYGLPARVPPFYVGRMAPAEVISPRPVRPGPKHGWFHGAIRPARPDERFPNDPDDWSRGGLAGGGRDWGPGSGGGGRVSPSPRPQPAPVTHPNPPIRRR